MNYAQFLHFFVTSQLNSKWSITHTQCNVNIDASIFILFSWYYLNRCGIIFVLCRKIYCIENQHKISVSLGNINNSRQQTWQKKNILYSLILNEDRRKSGKITFRGWFLVWKFDDAGDGSLTEVTSNMSNFIKFHSVLNDLFIHILKTLEYCWIFLTHVIRCFNVFLCHWISFDLLSLFIYIYFIN